MKKLLALILCALLVFSVVACSPKRSVSREDANELADNLEEIAEADEEEVEEVEAVEEVDDEKKVSRGVISGNNYYSEFTGLTFTAPNTWTYSTDEELASLMGVALDLMNVNEFAQTVAESATIYDMMVTNTETNSNVIVLYENTDITNAGKDITLDEYIDAVDAQLQAQTALSTEIVARTEVVLCGEEYVKLVLDTEMNGISFTQVYYVRQIDNIMISIVTTVMGNDSVDAIEAMFAA